MFYFKAAFISMHNDIDVGHSEIDIIVTLKFFVWVEATSKPTIFQSGRDNFLGWTSTKQ